MKNEKKENIALAAGFALIIFVIIFTVVRNKFFEEKTTSESGEESLSAIKALSPGLKTISATELNRRIMLSNKNEALTLVDIRPFEDYINEHILDAKNIPLDEFPASSKIDGHSLIVLIGKNNEDEDIKNAAKKLKEEKIENIVVLAGGMDSWKELVGATVTYGNPKSFADQAKVSYLDPQELNDALSQAVPVFIVDVRSSGEYSNGHIKGSINIPIDELEKRRFEVKEKKVVVVGANELQEFQASVQLYDMLLATPFVMRGAMPKWEEAKFELVK